MLNYGVKHLENRRVENKYTVFNYLLLQSRKSGEDKMDDTFSNIYI